ncbi:hypothetical protein Kisp01_30850 [Kineosporia sp. NBRC 101677]|uniref:copper resistance CopC family protein n=1 Tax=Kineosporia sp. NBRC 101677 TaxID=3032197 RepID=UPI0024A3929A|nr:copper resistance protein CopC [Kineosporia sp. NBRC 101677]GLY16070.1 hypothetical protein Kisp01_30850 [Kineosporia sp. NBRC 101677]
MLWLRVGKACGALRTAAMVSVAGAGLGLSLTGTAFADTGEPGPKGEIGRSPYREVVQYAPNAVSVTFGTALRESGASMSIRTKYGEVGEGKVSTSARTLRRSLVVGAPNGPYTVDWEAVAKDGRKFSGTFSFTAGHPNDDPRNPGRPSPKPTGTEERPQPSTSSDPAPSVAATASPSVKDAWAYDDEASVAPVRTDREPPSNGGAAYGFPLLALGVGSLLVLASGLVSRRHRPAVAERLTIRTSRGIYSV